MSVRYTFINILRKPSIIFNKYIQVRNGSYTASPFLEDVGEITTKFEKINDPNEWKYVERALPPSIIPEPISKDRSASGWKPQGENLKDKAYFIQRTKNHMLPVYLKISQGGLKRHTIIKKIQGDINVLEKELLEFLQPESFKPIRSQVNEFVGYIRINGDFVNATKYFFEKRNF
ncbi:probable 39S ribosomal protein L49, mitochondrial [Diorhabda sublineata]|uniref:probable 39S ribosomal protein L49, mitochondrial n=1 Tax=Diorhabda sublineata TaxID=1163346 RepID=UPI0024E144EC|nr:probable 39S ribosomal protein L49, mitochondrial [Diorhabda sublineata]